MNTKEKGVVSSDRALVPASPDAADASLNPLTIAQALNQMPENLRAHELLHLQLQDTLLANEVMRLLKDLPSPAIRKVPTGGYYDPKEQVMVFGTVTIIEGEATEVEG